MAIITKRYRRQNITDDDLARFAGNSATVNANFTDVIDIDYDDTAAGAESSVDECMSSEGFFPDAPAPAVMVDAHGSRHALGGADPIPGDVSAIGEKWSQQNIAASQTNVDLGCLVSTSFTNIKMIRPGSIRGLSTRFTEAITDVTVDSIIVKVTKNGAPVTLQLSSSSGVNPSGGEATQAQGIDTFVAGDLIGIEITTLASFLPATTDIEAWIDVSYS